MRWIYVNIIFAYSAYRGGGVAPLAAGDAVVVCVCTRSCQNRRSVCTDSSCIITRMKAQLTAVRGAAVELVGLAGKGQRAGEPGHAHHHRQLSAYEVRQTYVIVSSLKR